MTKKITKLALAKQNSLLSEAINLKNEDAARLIVTRALDSIHSRNASWKRSNYSDQEIEAVVALVKGINPKDTVESILAAQFVSLHLQATTNMSSENYNIMSQNLQMMRLSHQALNMLQQYRGKCQNINVNYNLHSEGDAILNTLIQMGDKDKKENKS